MLERSSDIVPDTDFLLEHKLHAAQAIDAVLERVWKLLSDRCVSQFAGDLSQIQVT